MNKPELRGLNQLDAAVLLQKMITLNGMLNYGTAEEKQKAETELKILYPEIKNSINLAAIEQAKYELNITEEELSSTSLYGLREIW